MRAAAQSQVSGKSNNKKNELYPLKTIKKYIRGFYRYFRITGYRAVDSICSSVNYLYKQAIYLPHSAWRRSRSIGGEKQKKRYNPGLAKKLAADEVRAQRQEEITNKQAEEGNSTSTVSTASSVQLPQYNNGNAKRLRNAINQMEAAGKGKSAQILKREVKLLKETCKKECNKKSKAEKKEIEEKYEKLEKELIEKYQAGAPPPTAAEIELEEEAAQMMMGNLREMTEKQQKAKNKKQQKEERLAEAKRNRDADLEGVIPLSTIETAKMDKQRVELGFKLKDIASDGNCLFRAFEHQLSVAGIGKVPTHQELRAEIADYLIKNKFDFQPFMEEPHDTDEGYERYVEDIRGNMWGGDVEISAFSKIYQMRVEVYQGFDEPVIHMGEDFPNGPVRLSFHKHLYTCPHYNSLLVEGAEK